MIERRYIYLIVLIILAGLSGTDVFSQKKSRALIRNVDMEVVNDKVRIHYDIVKSRPDFLHQVDCKFITQDYRIVEPYTLSGDIGSEITPGRGKTIEWDIRSDIKSLPSKIRPQLYLDKTNVSNLYNGGPSNALLSLLVPGLGDYYVSDHRYMKFKPYYRTAAALGFIGLGIVAKQQRTRAPGYYKTYAQWERTFEYGRYDRVLKQYERWTEGDIQYWLFRNDAEIFFITGGIIWVADVIWVAAKGSQNQKLKSYLESNDYSIDKVPGGLALTYTRSF